MKHPFFDALEQAAKIEKKAKVWGAGTANKRDFFRYLKDAHPFVFDRKVSHEKQMAGRMLVNFENIVEDFSIPHSTSLYLLNSNISLSAPLGTAGGETVVSDRLGYLIREITPERFMVFEVSLCHLPDAPEKKMPIINQYELNLSHIETMLAHLSALREDSDIGRAVDRKPESHVFKETGVILELTKSISVKRIGIEKFKSFSVKSRGIGTGFTVVKEQNLYHIADKEEYEYTTRPLDDDGNIKWEFAGWWRGHWRAFYCKDSTGKHVRDSFGRNTVDYNRVGKDRAGEYNTPGYTWIREHIKGDPELAEIKTHYVVNK